MFIYCLQIVITEVTLSETVSVRIPQDLKEKLDELGINVSEAVRKCLIRVVAREENMRRLEEVDRAVRVRGIKLPKGTAEGLIREERDLEH